MAVINFVKGEQYYTAEFQINGPVNIHIERVEAGALYFRQRSIDHGSYDLINGANWNNRGDLTIDTAIQGVVYPMWIKIESASEPTLAEMVEGEQSGGGAGTAESTMEYYSIDWDKARELGYDETNDTSIVGFTKQTQVVIGSANTAKMVAGGTTQAGSGASMLVYGATQYVTQVAYNFPIYGLSDGEWIEAANLNDYISKFVVKVDISPIFIPITKEQFYNLEA